VRRKSAKTTRDDIKDGCYLLSTLVQVSYSTRPLVPFCSRRVTLNGREDRIVRIEVASRLLRLGPEGAITSESDVLDAGCTSGVKNRSGLEEAVVEYVFFFFLRG
jgi:hypothetical protein